MLHLYPVLCISLCGTWSYGLRMDLSFKFILGSCYSSQYGLYGSMKYFFEKPWAASFQLLFFHHCNENDLWHSFFCNCLTIRSSVKYLLPSKLTFPPPHYQYYVLALQLIYIYIFDFSEWPFKLSFACLQLLCRVVEI